MAIGRFLTKVTASMAKVYSRMPIKPFSSTFRKIYFGYIYSDNGRSLVAKRIDGVNFELDLREVIDHAMYFQGTREPGTSRALKRLCKGRDTVLDIGANVGSHALPMANYVGTEGRVYAFEPVPWAQNKLKRNLELNNFDNLTLEPIALSDVDQEQVEMEFRASFKLGSKSGVGADGKINSGWWSECEHVKVRMETLDHYVTRHQIDRIDLIKLDVDGFEGKVIRGALQSLRRFQPILIMEIAPAWTEMRGDDMRDIVRQIERLGYKFFTELEFERIHDVIEKIDRLPPGGGFNVVASVRELG